MRYLLDTHTAFWYFEGSHELSLKAKAAIENSDNFIYVSVVSAWEIAIKRSISRYNNILCSVTEFLDEIAACGFELITLTPNHVIPVETLPYHHRDPFDRLLISTAIIEEMVFISGDENVPKYNIKWLW